jgi:hypothetical protein
MIEWRSQRQRWEGRSRRCRHTSIASSSPPRETGADSTSSASSTRPKRSSSMFMSRSSSGPRAPSASSSLMASSPSPSPSPTYGVYGQALKMPFFFSPFALPFLCICLPFVPPVFVFLVGFENDRKKLNKTGYTIAVGSEFFNPTFIPKNKEDIGRVWIAAANTRPRHTPRAAVVAAESAAAP